MVWVALISYFSSTDIRGSNGGRGVSLKLVVHKAESVAISNKVVTVGKEADHKAKGGKGRRWEQVSKEEFSEEDCKGCHKEAGCQTTCQESKGKILQAFF